VAKRIIPRAMFEPVEEFRAEDLLQTPQLVNMVKREAPLAIKAALEENKTFASIFEIGASGMFIDIPKSYWIDALEQCISYSLEEEKFEDCIELKKLIDEIKQIGKTAKKNYKPKKNGATSNGNTVSNK
jgi:hypothetical protein